MEEKLSNVWEFIKANRRKITGALLGIAGMVIGAKLVLDNEEDESVESEDSAEE